MRIEKLRINHIERPLGYLLRRITATYQVTQAKGRRQERARILVARDPELQNIVFDTGITDSVSPLGTPLIFRQEPSARYYWKVQVWDDEGDCGESGVSWFETGLLEEGWEGISITPQLEDAFLPVMEKDFTLDKLPERARLYICGLGVFEAFLNGSRVGEEEMTPYLTPYHSYVQYLTFDVGSLLRIGENNLRVHLGGGWYKGNYGYRQNEDYALGRRFQLLAQMNLWDQDGAVRRIGTDLSWKAAKSNVTISDIYEGEWVDDTLEDARRYPVRAGDLDPGIVKERLSMPVSVMEHLAPAAILHTPKGETVIDMGQNMVGRLSFRCRGKRGERFLFEHGEVLQDGCFYRDNYRTAKAMFSYVSDGIEKEVHPRFTFFGFRYVRVTCRQPLRLTDFRGEVIYSCLERTGTLTTGNQLVNRLISNILWSQKGNFLDVPTDCPQRDEQLGWTGDAQIFARTACLNMECYSFFAKYLHDISLEQEEAGGMVPQVVPNVDRSRKTSAAWGDAAVIIPWALYEIYGDASVLEEQFESMCSWVAYIDRMNREHGTHPDLWQNGFHYGDWLALDGGYYHMPVGGTDTYYLSSAYFYLSVSLTARAAGVLEKRERERYYREKAARIKAAIRQEYFTPNGGLCMDTQTGYLTAIVFGLYEGEEQKKRLGEKLEERLRKDGYQLKTGFVGTPALLPALSMTGRQELAYRILLDTSCPGWLYPVTMGATTMWERWDSIRPDGHISDTGMNSLNHYANGSVMEWLYGYMAGIRQQEGSVGYRRVEICPGVHPALKSVSVRLDTAMGCYGLDWRIQEGNLEISLDIPFGGEARVTLPYVKGKLRINGAPGQETEFTVASGHYELEDDYIPRHNMAESVRELIRSQEIREYLYRRIPMLERIDGAEIQNMTLPELARLPFFLGIGTKLGMGQETLYEVEEYIGGKVRY